MMGISLHILSEHEPWVPYCKKQWTVVCSDDVCKDRI